MKVNAIDYWYQKAIKLENRIKNGDKEPCLEDKFKWLSEFCWFERAHLNYLYWHDRERYILYVNKRHDELRKTVIVYAN